MRNSEVGSLRNVCVHELHSKQQNISSNFNSSFASRVKAIFDEKPQKPIYLKAKSVLIFLLPFTQPESKFK